MCTPEQVSHGGLAGADVLVEDLGPLDADKAHARGGHRGRHDVRLAAAGRPVQQDPRAQPQRRPVYISLFYSGFRVWLFNV